MKKIILPFSLRANHVFKFVDNKTNGALDEAFIQRLVETFKTDIFFETGTYTANTTVNATPYFKKVHTVELHDGLFAKAQKKLRPYKHVHVYHGKSPDIIKNIGDTLKGTVLFWLDAHYSGYGTAFSGNNPDIPEAITAIREELAAIKQANITDCVILIDDIRGFGSEISGKKYLGCWAYPTMQEVREALLKINTNFELALLGDMLLAFDKKKYQPKFSDTVMACTKTRLYDGYNLSDEELIELEQKIMQAPSDEGAYIEALYKIMTDYQDPMFWHDLWYGLVALGAHKHSDAHQVFSKAKVRAKHGMTYDHWRIDHYMEVCNT